MKVVVGVDGSSNSFLAVEFIGRLLSPERDHLVLIYATPPLDLEEELDPKVEERARSVLSRTVLEAALERLPEAFQSRVEQKEITGSPSLALLNVVNEQAAELVVVGFRGTGSLWERFILGSVSRTVVHSATVPVLVVKRRPDDTTETGEAFPAAPSQLRALAAYDGPATAEAMARVLGRFTWPDEAEGCVMTVIPPMFLADLPEWVRPTTRDPDVAAMAAAWELEHQQNLQSARGELEQFRAKLPPCFAAHDVLVMEGRPADEIVGQLQAKDMDLAVVGSRGSGRVERLLLGSTSEQVLSAAPCSVLIVR